MLINKENVEAIIEGTEDQIRNLIYLAESDRRLLELFATLLELIKYIKVEVSKLEEKDDSKK